MRFNFVYKKKEVKYTTHVEFTWFMCFGTFGKSLKKGVTCLLKKKEINKKEMAGAHMLKKAREVHMLISKSSHNKKEAYKKVHFARAPKFGICFINVIDKIQNVHSLKRGVH